jgi:DnaJ-class molecular chaperone
VHLRVPKGTHTGTRLRLAGKGLGKTGERGDLFVRIEIDIPDSFSTKAEALLKQLEEEIHG